jgi:hypothetical protein
MEKPNKCVIDYNTGATESILDEMGLFQISTTQQEPVKP